MDNLIRNPITILVLSFFTMWLAAQAGDFIRKRQITLEEAEQQEHDFIVNATLTLLALIVGFSFSMAIGRYDMRKNYEEAEANAIGTEYVRAGLLPADDAAKVRTLLKEYLDARILFYLASDEQKLQQVNAHTAQLQSDLWSVVKTPANAQPTFVMALAVSGMNDVLNSQGYTQAAWWNRIPTGAWCLMFAMAICSNMLVGYSARRTHGGLTRLHVLPIVLCIAFFFIADLDNPRKGIIRVVPQNLISLAVSLHGQ
jgi:hypothetical protein